MNFILDKFTDAIFIFLGVYFAFHFDQYQKDLSLKKELEFNLSEIMATLPKEKPLKFIEPFKIRVKKNKETCSYSTSADFESRLTGGDFLRVIKDLGLMQFLEKKDLISTLTVYYADVIPDFKEKRRLFRKQYQSVLVEALRSSGGCMSREQVSAWEKSVDKYYMDAKIQDGLALHIGYYIRSQLVNLGYKASERKSYELNYSFEIADDEKKLQLIEDRKKARKIEKVGEG